jgi:hypothetical protein
VKGALVELKEGAPNVVVFQFNPETLRHSWSQEAAPAGANPLAVQGVPGESFSFAISMEVTDELTDANPAVVLDATLNGLYARLSALEMLMFPTAMPGLAGVGAAGDREVPAAQVPTVLFVWGLGRIVPVRVTSLTITENIFDAQLNPTHAEATLELRVLTPTQLDALQEPFKTFAKGAYNYTQGKRVALAVANLIHTAGAIELPPLPGL